MSIFCQVGDADDFIYRVWEQGVPDVGPAPRMAVPRTGTRYETLDAWFDAHTPPTPTCVPKYNNGRPFWFDTSELAVAIAAAVARTYVDVDGIYEAAVGRRVTEYARAEDAALAYKAAGFTGPVSDYVSGHAKSNPTGEVRTNAWAAQQIIERADAFRWAELQMRNVRFDRQKDMRAAADHAKLQAVVAQWNGFIAFLHAILAV